MNKKSKKKLKDIAGIFKLYGLPYGKSLEYEYYSYLEIFPDNEVFQDIDIYVETLGLIWNGDLDFTRYESTLKLIADEINYDLYIVQRGSTGMLPTPYEKTTLTNDSIKIIERSSHAKDSKSNFRLFIRKLFRI